MFEVTHIAFVPQRRGRHAQVVKLEGYRRITFIKRAVGTDAPLYVGHQNAPLERDLGHWGNVRQLPAPHPIKNHEYVWICEDRSVWLAAWPCAEDGARIVNESGRNHADYIEGGTCLAASIHDCKLVLRTEAQTSA